MSVLPHIRGGRQRPGTSPWVRHHLVGRSPGARRPTAVRRRHSFGRNGTGSKPGPGTSERGGTTVKALRPGNHRRRACRVG
ncbi:hypothetical protein MicB006_5581 [Micromonospora sp. B006]|nr:hypothetical protein MicB006_5581 [Micromonospora sp. B006]